MNYSSVSDPRRVAPAPGRWLHAAARVHARVHAAARARYRVAQFWSALQAQVAPSELQTVREILPAPAWALFTAMPLPGQRHSLNVLYALQAQGYRLPADRDLLAAALLHDAAKAGHLRLWHRVALVLLELTRPGRRLLRWLARPAAPGHWRYPFYVIADHAARGAAQALAAGCSPTTAWLIERHQTPMHHSAATDAQRAAWLLALQKVDDEL